MIVSWKEKGRGSGGGKAQNSAWHEAGGFLMTFENMHRDGVFVRFKEN